MSGPRWPFVVPPAPAAPPRAEPPTFSVVVPAYQAAGVVAGAVRSALAQTVPAVEVVVVDDGSTDDLAGALRPFGDRVRLVRSAHVGLPAVRNLGVAGAVGEFVAFLDADDAYEPDFLAALGSLAQQRPDLDILTADAWFDVAGTPTGTFHAANPFPVHDQRTAVLTGCFLTTMTAVRRSRLLEVGGFDARLTHGEDWDCWIRLVLDGSRAGLVDAPLSRYRIHDGQLSARRAASLRGRYEIMSGLVDRADLAPAERAAVAARLPALRVRVAVAEAVESTAGQLGVRRAWLRVATLPATPRRSRLAALAALASPRLGAALTGVRRAARG